MSNRVGNGAAARLVLADGTTFEGEQVGAPIAGVGEVVFTTGMTGYQEVLSDPSYCEQILTMTSPHIGNTGAIALDGESRRPFVAGFVTHHLSFAPSNWRSETPLPTYLSEQGVGALTGVDTRSLTAHIRQHGAQMGAMGTEDRATLHDRAKAAPPMGGRDLTGVVTCREPYEWTGHGGESGLGPWTYGFESPGAATRLHVVAVDFGLKFGILRCLHEAGCRVTVVPAHTGASEILALAPDGVFLSNGPGDPGAAASAVEMVSALLGKVPLFGICLGHQLLCRALGGSTSKLKFGHRGMNQPVQDLDTGRVEITTQNHGFVVDWPSLEGRCELTHVHLNDGSCEGIVHRETGSFGVQYHPESSAGPHDSRYLFTRFVERMRGA